MALMKVVNDILRNMDRQHITAVVALDLSAAFDTVDHNTLLQVLETTYGIKGGALQWFADYLQGRKTRILINNTLSRDKELPFSVPQGSCAGPVLYNLYASTLENSIKHLNMNIIGYADDHTLYDSFAASSRSDEINCINNLEHCIAETKTWMDKNRLKMNCAKTEFCLFGNKPQTKKCVIGEMIVNNESIKASEKMKYLGITMDKEMNFKKFIAEKCRKCNFALKNIRDIRSHLSKSMCHQLVNSLVTSKLDYANGVLDKLPYASIRPLQMMQNRAAKLVLLRKKTDSSTQARKELHWLPVSERTSFKTLCIAHKCVYGKAPEYLQKMFQQEKLKQYNLRSQDKVGYVVPQTKCKTYGDRAFSVNGPKQWNMLPLEIRAIENFNKFKKALKTHKFALTYTHT